MNQTANPTLSARADGPEQGSQRPALPHKVILPTALLLGLTGNFLIRSPGGPGLNVFLFFLALALAIVAIGTISRRAVKARISPRTGMHAGAGFGLALSREAWFWMIAGLLLASGLVLRAAPALQLLAFGAAAAAFAFPALRAGAAWMWRSGVGDHLEAIFGAMVYSGFGSVCLAADRLSHAPAPKANNVGPRKSPAILRGLLLAAPLLFVFGALFMSADRVFAGLVTGLLGTAVDDLMSHVVVSAILAWLAAGYFTGLLTGTRIRSLVEGRVRRPFVGIVEVGIALGLVDLLFVAFVAVQFRYLFGGAGLVEVTPGLTYAEYAREGFAQLALASALVLPSLLASDWLLRPRSNRNRTVFRVLGGLQLLLLGVVILSALQRVAVYQAAYGLTESRFYGVIFLGWLIVLSAWFAATVLRGRREHFASPALLSGFAVVAMLLVANPDARIARTNLARVELSGATAEQKNGYIPRPVDVAYLGSLSADAVPVIMRALPRLPPEARCPLAARLLERWGDERRWSWRSWNHSVARARHAVQTAGRELRAMTDPGNACTAE